MAQIVAATLVVLLILLVLFLIFRELLCWYWKINEQLGVLQQIRSSLQVIERALAGGVPAASADTAVKKAPRTDCWKCGRLLEGNRFCEHCGSDNQ